MARKNFSFFEKRALWEVNNKECSYCSAPLHFSDVEIEHIVPISLENQDQIEREVFFKNYGLNISFNLNDLENLTVACRKCNGKKADLKLEVGQISIFIAKAKKNKPACLNLIEKFKRENEKDKEKFNIGEKINLGQLTKADIDEIFKKTKSEKGIFAVNFDSDLVAGMPYKNLSIEKIQEYKNSDKILPDWMDNGLDLTHEDGRKVIVRTLAQYEEAVAQGFFAYSNASMKMERVVFLNALELLNYLLKAHYPKFSAIDEPFLGVADIRLLPATLLRLGMTDDPLANKDDFENKSIEELLELGNIKIVRLSSYSISVESKEHDIYLTVNELFRADINNDGFNEIVVSVGKGVLTGTYSSGYITSLSKKAADRLFVEGH